MTKTVVETKFYHFRQNNSGGSFDINDTAGIGVNVWVEATSKDDANDRAERIGIYFDGCEDGRDCSCCGDRWNTVWEDGVDEVKPNPEWDFIWDGTVYVHRLDGSIERITKTSDAA